MALRLIDGVPGSGKTYYAVNHLMEKYASKISNVCVYANIESLIIPHVDLNELVEKKGVDGVFNVEFFQGEIEKNAGKQHIMIIDEAQRYFHKKFFNNDVFFFFQYHRHFGMDIYIITQNEKLIPLQITSMSECTIHAQPRSVSIFGELKYLVKVAGENVERVVLKPKTEIFDLYKSMKKLEGEKPKKVFRKYFIWMGLLVAAIPVVFYFTFLYHPKKTEVQNVQTGKPALATQAHPSSIAEAQAAVYTENDKTMAYICGNIVLGGKILVEDPILNKMVPLAMCDYPIKVKNYGATIVTTGYFPREKLERILEERKKEEDQRLARESAASHGRASERGGFGLTTPSALW